MVDNESGDIVAVAREASRSYGPGGSAVVALQSTSCDIHRGKRIAIMGPSGSGKSTLLHLFAGLDEATAGEIEWPTLGERASLRPGKVAIALQAPSLVPFLSAIENVSLPCRLLDTESDPLARAAEALSTFDLTAFAEKLPEELSGGQAQRVALARATASRPRLLLADEPTGQLDRATGQAVIARLIGWAKAAGAALVVATHDPLVANAFDEIWLMDHGRIVTRGGQS